MDEQSFQVNGIDFEMVGRLKVADNFQVGARQALVVEHAHGRVVAMQRDQFMVGEFETARRQLASNGEAGHGRRLEGRD